MRLWLRDCEAGHFETWFTWDASENQHCHSSGSSWPGRGFSTVFYRDLTNDKAIRALWNQPRATTYALPFLVCSGLLNLKFWPTNTNKVIESQKFWPTWVTELTKLSHRKTSKNSHFMSLIANSEVQMRLSPIRYLLLIKMAWNSHYKGSIWESHGCAQSWFIKCQV